MGGFAFAPGRLAASQGVGQFRDGWNVVVEYPGDLAQDFAELFGGTDESSTLLRRACV